MHQIKLINIVVEFKISDNEEIFSINKLFVVPQGHIREATAKKDVLSLRLLFYPRNRFRFAISLTLALRLIFIRFLSAVTGLGQLAPICQSCQLQANCRLEEGIFSKNLHMLR